MAVPRKAMTEGIRTPIFLCAFIDAVLQSLSQKSKIFASSLYTREPWVLPHQCVCRCFSEEPENCTTFRIHLRKEETPSQGQGHTDLRLAARDSPTG